MLKRVYCQEFDFTTLFKGNLPLNHTEYSLIPRVTILWWTQHVEIGFDALKIMLILKINSTLAHTKIGRRGIGANTSWWLMSAENWTYRIIRGWSHNSCETFESIRIDSKVKTLDVVRVEAERFRTATAPAEKKGFFHRILTGDEKWVHNKNPRCRRCWDRARPWINTGGKVEYSWFEASTLHLEGSTRGILLWAAQTDWSHHERSLSTSNDAFEPRLEEKK